MGRNAGVRFHWGMGTPAGGKKAVVMSRLQKWRQPRCYAFNSMMDAELCQ